MTFVWRKLKSEQRMLKRRLTTVQYASSLIWSRANEMHAKPPFPCDYITSRNGYRKCVMTSTAESKRGF